MPSETGQQLWVVSDIEWEFSRSDTRHSKCKRYTVVKCTNRKWSAYRSGDFFPLRKDMTLVEARRECTADRDYRLELLGAVRTTK